MVILSRIVAIHSPNHLRGFLGGSGSGRDSHPSVRH